MYKFQTLNRVFLYDVVDRPLVNLLSQANPNVWESTIKLNNPPFPRGSRVRRERIKNFIKQELLAIQGDYCIYCGVKFRTNSDAQREHILPKDIYPQYTFEAQNLVLSCGRCNGFDYKHTKDYAIAPVNRTHYYLNTFEIIHPYLDNLHDHLDVSGVVLSVKNNSAKGRKTIDEFGLNDEFNLGIRGGHFYKQRYETADGALLRLAADAINFSRR